jgi:hypothetical protein
VSVPETETAAPVKRAWLRHPNVGKIFVGTVVGVLTVWVLGGFGLINDWVQNTFFPTRTCAKPGDVTLLHPPDLQATATSELRPGRTLVYTADQAIDDKTSTAWVEGVKDLGRGQSLTITLSRKADVALVCVMNGYTSDPSHYRRNGRIHNYTATTDKGATRGVFAIDDTGFRDYQQLAIKAGPTQKLTITIDSTLSGVPDGDKPAESDTAISEVQVYVH